MDLQRTEIETSDENVVTECMLNKVSIHVFVSSSKKFIKTVLKRSFLCCPCSNFLSHISFSAIA